MKLKDLFQVSEIVKVLIIQYNLQTKAYAISHSLSKPKANRVRGSSKAYPFIESMGSTRCFSMSSLSVPTTHLWHQAVGIHSDQIMKLRLDRVEQGLNLVQSDGRSIMNVNPCRLILPQKLIYFAWGYWFLPQITNWLRNSSRRGTCVAQRLSICVQLGSWSPGPGIKPCVELPAQ